MTTVHEGNAILQRAAEMEKRGDAALQRAAVTLQRVDAVVSREAAASLKRTVLSDLATAETEYEKAIDLRRRLAG